MGRDFTPKKLHEADKALNLRLGDLRIIDKDGNEIAFAGDKYRDRYPNLSFLAGEVLENLIDKTDPDESVLTHIEQAITFIIDAFENSWLFNGSDNPEDELNNPEEQLFDTLRKWYFGELDSSFYYNEANNRLLEEYLTEYIQDQKGKE